MLPPLIPLSPPLSPPSCNQRPYWAPATRNRGHARARSPAAPKSNGPRHRCTSLSLSPLRSVKTPGGKFTLLQVKKRGSRPSCGDCGAKLAGIKEMRKRELQRASRRMKTVSRAYGGSRCADCTRTRVIKAFLTEEAAIVKRMSNKN